MKGEKHPDATPVLVSKVGRRTRRKLFIVFVLYEHRSSTQTDFKHLLIDCQFSDKDLRHAEDTLCYRGDSHHQETATKLAQGVEDGSEEAARRKAGDADTSSVYALWAA